MRTILSLSDLEAQWLVKLAAGMPGGIGNTGFECGGLTSPLVLLGLRYGLGAAHEGVSLIFYKSHSYRQRFWARHASLQCNSILGKSRVPICCIGVVRHAPEMVAEVVADDCTDVIPDEQRQAYRQLYTYWRGKGFHCAHALKKPCFAYAVDAGAMSTFNQRLTRRIASQTDHILVRS